MIGQEFEVEVCNGTCEILCTCCCPISPSFLSPPEEAYAACHVAEYQRALLFLWELSRRAVVADIAVKNGVADVSKSSCEASLESAG